MAGRKKEGPGGFRKYSDKMKFVNDVAQRRDAETQRAIQEVQSLRVPPQSGGPSGGGLMQVPGHAEHNLRRSMPDISTILVAQEHQGFSRPANHHSNGGCIVISQPTPVIMSSEGRQPSADYYDSSPHSGGGVLKRTKSMHVHRARSVSPNLTSSNGRTVILGQRHPHPTASQPLVLQIRRPSTDLSLSPPAAVAPTGFLAARRQTEADIFHTQLPSHGERKVSEPAGPIPIIIIGPDHADSQDSMAAGDQTNHNHLHHNFTEYRKRRHSTGNPHSPGPSTPGTPGSPESDFNSDPNSPTAAPVCQTAEQLAQMLSEQMLTPVCDGSPMPPGPDSPAVYHLMAPPSLQLLPAGGQLEAQMKTSQGLLEFETIFSQISQESQESQESQMEQEGLEDAVLKEYGV